MSLENVDDTDLSPKPNYVGQFVSLGALGDWRRPTTADNLLEARTNAKGATREDKQAPEADCSPKSIVHSAENAPKNFQFERNGLLYGVRTHTPATRVDDMPGFNSCALVVYAILKNAGCKWARNTANAKGIYDMAYRAGWRPADRQRGGCMVAWNSRWEGKRARIGQGKDSPQVKGGVLFRHVGITTGSWMAVDNSGVIGRPTAFITTRPIRYESPIFLCPPDMKAGNDSQQNESDGGKKGSGKKL